MKVVFVLDKRILNCFVKTVNNYTAVVHTVVFDYFRSITLNVRFESIDFDLDAETPIGFEYLLVFIWNLEATDHLQNPIERER